MFNSSIGAGFRDEKYKFQGLKGLPSSILSFKVITLFISDNFSRRID